MEEKELDLIEISAKTFLFIRKYFFVLVFFALLGVAYGSLRKKNNPVKYYESSIYASTGLLYSPRGYEPYINALYADLKTVSSKISDTIWVKKYFHQDSTTFIFLDVKIDKNLYRYNSPLIKLTLRAKSYDDFNKFRKGILYYYKYHSPLRRHYNAQIRLRRQIKGPFYRNVIKSTLSNFDSLELGLNISANTYDAYVLADMVLSRPLFYFTSDFQKVRKKRAEQNINFYIIIFSLLGVFISLFIELVIKTYNYLKEQNKKE